MDAVTSTSQNTAILLRSNRGGVATLTLNTPAKYNVLSVEMLGCLQQELDTIAGDSNVRVVVITGSGKAFCAGHDLKEMRAHTDKAFHNDLFSRCSRMMMTINRLPQPVIARVQGIATAGGCQLVAACDLAVAASNARFATSGISAGLFCGTPAVALSRNMLRKQAMEMLLTGEFINAETARQRGLVNRVAAPEALDAETDKLIQSILDKPAQALAAGKKLFYEQLEASQSAAYDQAGEFMACSMLGEEAAEGIDAFMQKRKPQWPNN